MLLSTLALDDEIRARIRAAFPGGGLERLLSTVEEFLLYHRKVEEEIRDFAVGIVGNDDGDGNREDPESEGLTAGFTGRLQGIVDRIRDAESGGSER